MRRALLVAVVLPLALSGCGADAASQPTGVPLPGRARPQVVDLGWVERYPEQGEKSLVFRFHNLRINESGWSVYLAITNGTGVPWAIGQNGTEIGRTFGVMVFRTGDQRELDQRNQAGELPAARRATTFVPDLVPLLEPDASWIGTMSARGSLPAGTWLRVVVGAFIATPEPPEGLAPQVTWITDHAHPL
jgi:hypothetical protein